MRLSPFASLPGTLRSSIRDLCEYAGASMRSGFDQPPSSEFLGTLAHGGEPHTVTIGGRQALPVVDDFHGHLLSAHQANDAGMGMGMTHDVGQRFLHDAIAGHLDRSWQWRKWPSCLHGEGDAACPILREELPNGCDQAEIIQGGRAQRVDQAANVADRLL